MHIIAIIAVYFLSFFAKTEPSNRETVFWKLYIRFWLER